MTTARGEATEIARKYTSNDFVRSIYEKYTIEELLMDLLNGSDEKLDIVQIGTRYFLNIASVGLDAEIVYNASAYKKLSFIKGDMAYVISLFKTILGPKGMRAKVVLDGKEICNEKILLLAAANGAFYGGGIHIVPQAVVNDALLDVCLVRNVRFSKIARVLPKLFKARHGEANEVEMYQVKEVSIEAPEGCKLNIDGEIISTYNVNIRMIPAGITMRLPARNLVQSKKVYSNIL